MFNLDYYIVVLISKADEKETNGLLYNCIIGMYNQILNIPARNAKDVKTISVIF